MIFGQGKNIPLNQSSNNLPNVGDAMMSWTDKIICQKVEKKTINFQIVELLTPFNFEGVWQPASPQRIQMKPEGQRNWKWFTLHAKPSLVLVPDEIILYLGTKYRVSGKSDYSTFGYVMYDLHEDYEDLA